MGSTGWRGLDLAEDPVRMVDVSGKPQAQRLATARGFIKLKPETVKAIREGGVAKGDPLQVAEVAAILAAKKTPELAPLCHNIPLSKVDVSYRVVDGGVEATCTVKAVAVTGVEMEALTGVVVALLNIWDMVKYLEKDEGGQYPYTRITDVRVVEKVKSVEPP